MPELFQVTQSTEGLHPALSEVDLAKEWINLGLTHKQFSDAMDGVQRFMDGEEPELVLAELGLGRLDTSKSEVKPTFIINRAGYILSLLALKALARRRNTMR